MPYPTRFDNLPELAISELHPQLQSMCRESAIHPALAQANCRFLIDNQLENFLLGFFTEQAGKQALQYVTTGVANRIDGWDAQIATGAIEFYYGYNSRLRLITPRIGADGKKQRYHSFTGYETNIFQPVVPGHENWLNEAIEAGDNILLVEGEKKALSAITAGYPAIAVSGITMGYRRDDNGQRHLVPELEALAKAGANFVICFDSDRKLTSTIAVNAAAACLAKLLKAAGASVTASVLPITTIGAKSAIDDLLAAGSGDYVSGYISQQLNPLVFNAISRISRRKQIKLEVAETVELDYIPSDTDLCLRIINSKFSVLDSPMGTGKTQAIRFCIENDFESGGNLIISPTQALCADVASKIPDAVARHHLQKHGDVYYHPDGTVFDFSKHNLVCCPEAIEIVYSIMRLSPRRVWIDEAAQVAETILNSSTIKSRRKAIYSLTQLVSGGSIHLSQDGLSIDMASIAFYAAIAASNPDIIIKNIVQPKVNPLIRICTESQLQKVAAEYFNKKQPIWYTSDSKATTEEAAALAEEAGAKYLLINGDTSGGDEVQEFLSAPEAWVLKHPGYSIIASPSISSGVSVAVNGAFAAVLGHFGGDSISPDNCTQQLFRYRCADVIYLYAADNGRYDTAFPTSNPAEVKKLIAEDKQRFIDVLNDLDAMRLLPAPEDELLENNMLISAWCQMKADSFASAMEFGAEIIAKLHLRGCPITRLETVAESTGSEILSNRKAFSKLRKKAKQAAIAAAPIITHRQAQELEEKRQLKPEDKAALAKYHVADGLAINPSSVTQDDVELWDKWGQAIIRSEKLNSLLAGNYQRFEHFQDDEVSWGLDGGQRELVVLELLRRCGIEQFLSPEAKWHKQSPALHDFIRQLSQHAATIQRLSGVKLLNEKEAVAVLNKLLKWLGYEVTAKSMKLAVEVKSDEFLNTIPEFSSTTVAKEYSLAPEWLAQLEAIHQRRKQQRELVLAEFR